MDVVVDFPIKMVIFHSYTCKRLPEGRIGSFFWHRITSSALGGSHWLDGTTRMDEFIGVEDSPWLGKLAITSEIAKSLVVDSADMGDPLSFSPPRSVW